MYAFFLIAGSMLANAMPAAADVGQTFQFPMARAPHPLTLDPSLADPAWQIGAVPNGTGPWQNVTTRSPAQFETQA
ncbi:MAG TPA: hypothetical protein VGK84_02680, partial [Candidatus Tumulicola sp.]